MAYLRSNDSGMNLLGKTTGINIKESCNAAGITGYGGFYWPVKEDGAAYFIEAFYQDLIELENFGLA